MAGATVKVTLQDETRRFDVVGTSFSGFKVLVSERFSISSDEFCVQYKDEDGDMVTVSSDAELREAIEDMSSKGSVKFFLSMVDKGSVSVPKAAAKKGEKREMDGGHSDAENSKQCRKSSKKLSKKEEKEAKKEALKREVLDELRKEFGNSGATAPRQPAESVPPNPPSPFQTGNTAGNDTGNTTSSVPSGEKLQSLLQAAVESLGVPPAQVYDYLNALTPEMVKSSLTLHSPIPSMLRMFFGRCGGESAPPPPPFSFGHRGHGHGHGHWRGPPHHWGAPPPPPPHHGFPHPAFPGHPHPGFWGPSPAAGSTFPAPPQDAAGAAAAETPFTGPNLSRGFCFGGRGWVGQGPVIAGARDAGALPHLPPAPLGFGACGDDVAALQSVLVVLGYLQCGPWHLYKKHYGRRTCEAVHRFQSEHGLLATGSYDEQTRAALLSKAGSLKGPDAANATTAADSDKQAGGETKEVEMIDTDGDVIRFCLSEDGRRVVEYVNGKVELEAVTYIQVDEDKGIVFDPLGRFTLKAEDRTVKLAQLRELLSLVGVTMAQVPSAPSAPSATVEIDLDLNATAEQMSEQQRVAGEAIRRACMSLRGATQETAQNIFSHLFEAVTSAVAETTPSGGKDAAAAETTEVKKSDGKEADAQPIFAFEQELVDILEMGFEDVELISGLLVKHGGNVSHVVTDLSDHRAV